MRRVSFLCLKHPTQMTISYDQAANVLIKVTLNAEAWRKRGTHHCHSASQTNRSICSYQSWPSAAQCIAWRPATSEHIRRCTEIHRSQQSHYAPDAHKMESQTIVGRSVNLRFFFFFNHRLHQNKLDQITYDCTPMRLWQQNIGLHILHVFPFGFGLIYVHLRCTVVEQKLNEKKNVSIKLNKAHTQAAFTSLMTTVRLCCLARMVSLVLSEDTSIESMTSSIFVVLIGSETCGGLVSISFGDSLRCPVPLTPNNGRSLGTVRMAG